MILPRFGVYQYVIDKYEDEFLEMRTKEIVHETLKSCWGID